MEQKITNGQALTCPLSQANDIVSDNPIAQRIREIRSDFGYLQSKDVTYLDNGATTQRPKQVIEAMSGFYTNKNANPHRGAYDLATIATSVYEEGRRKIKHFIGGDENGEVVFTRNATEALNLVAQSYGRSVLQAGDEIVITILEHHSNLVPWQQVAAQTGAVLKYVYLEDDLQLSMQGMEEAITEKTRIVAFTGAANTTGTYTDVEAIIRLAHAKQAVTVLDACQLIPHKQIYAATWDCDFVAFSGHKMLAPFGIGVLYAKKSLLEAMPPFLYGGDMIEYVYEQQSTFAPVPQKFEAGTQDVGGVAGLCAAIDYLEGLGMNHIEAYEKELTEYALQRLDELSFVEVYHPRKHAAAAVILFNVKDVHPHDVSSILDSHHVAIRSGHHCAMPLHRYLKQNASCRIGISFYNTRGEIDRLICALRQVRRIMGYGHE
ncbi:MAG: SufS family cysteine desulfurase [Eubacteriales bacterium]|nr:SufS family cysteine desulfurase [Eubacteriales bacterium]